MGKVFVITSGKGGVGKSTTTANLGHALADQGKNVLLIDSDIGLRNLDLVLGLENRVIFDIVDVLQGRCRARQAIIHDKKNSRLALLPASQTHDKTAVSPEQMEKLMNELKESYDFILIDCPAGIEQGFKNAIAGADEALLICTPEVSSIRDADRVIGLLSSTEIEAVRLIVNRVKYDLIRKGDMLSVEDVEEVLGLKAIGAIPDDELVIRGSNLGEAVINMGKSPAGAEYKRIASVLCGASVPELVKKSGLSSWLGKLFGLESKAG